MIRIGFWGFLIIKKSIKDPQTPILIIKAPIFYKLKQGFWRV